MDSHYLLLPLFAHVIWSALLYVLLTITRAPDMWGVGLQADGTNPWSDIEPRIAANLINQFEWPLFFYAICLLHIALDDWIDPLQVGLSWLFIVGRILHSLVQILTTNIKLRGMVFTINFLAVFAMWLMSLINIQ